MVSLVTVVPGCCGYRGNKQEDFRQRTTQEEGDYNSAEQNIGKSDSRPCCQNGGVIGE